MKDKRAHSIRRRPSLYVLALVMAGTLTGCGERLPKTYNFGGASIEVIGESWTPEGDSLLVRPMRCPWTAGGIPAEIPSLATIRIRDQSPDFICLIFTKDEVLQAYKPLGAYALETEDFRWASGWPGKWKLDSSLKEAIQKIRAAEASATSAAQATVQGSPVVSDVAGASANSPALASGDVAKAASQAEAKKRDR